MVKGKRRVATEVAEANGMLKKNKYRRDDSLAPRADGCTPEMPEYLDEYGREKWQELIGDLTNMNVISSDTREILIAYCEAYSGWMRCLKLVRKIGPVIIEEGKDGKPIIRKNHVCVELHKYREQMNRLLPEFGLTPSSRSKLVSFKELKEEDPFVTLLGRLSAGAN